ncbi:MAG TPA: hypothetical protein VFK79_11830 [Xanthobacteraceae bacterium]|nr:hypothetical protein [Xanthobacteraceae bacterium]
MIFRLVLLLFTLCAPTAAQAQYLWSTTANLCVPDATTTRFNRHNVGAASVQHAAGNVDLIVLNCPISPFNTDAHPSWFLRTSYQDSTGTNATAFIRARLYRMASTESSPTLLVIANSNSLTDTGFGWMNKQFFHIFDFSNYTYWVRVELDRSTTSQVVIFYSLALYKGA